MPDDEVVDFNYAYSDAEEELRVEALALIYKAMDLCQASDLEFDEVLDSARQSWMP